MTVTDAQVHVWARATPERPWSPGGAAFAHGEEYSTAQLLADMAAAGVDRAVLVPPSWEGDRNDVCLAAARAHPDRFAVMGRIAVDDPGSRPLLESWLDEPGMVGIRLTFSRPPAVGQFADGTADWIWDAAESAGIPIMLFAPGLSPEIGKIARLHESLRLVIDHLGIGTRLRDEEIDAPIEEAIALAPLPNVAVKASCLPSVVSAPYPFKSLHARVERVLDAFGPRRVFWGSDLSRLRCPYREAVTLFTEELTFLTGDDREWVMGRGVENWLSWDPVARVEGAGA